MDPLSKIIEFTDKAHGEQTRKYTPERYIVHPVRVMEVCREYNSSTPVLAAALLHDVLEDTPTTKKEMYQFLLSVMEAEEAGQTTQLVVELTDIYTKTKYPRWNRKKRKIKEAERIESTSADAQTIKYADIIDNCREITTEDPEFAGLFLFECRMLLRRMVKGHPALYQKAKETVEQFLKQVPREFRYRK